MYLLVIDLLYANHSLQFFSISGISSTGISYLLSHKHIKSSSLSLRENCESISGGRLPVHLILHSLSHLCELLNYVYKTLHSFS